MSKDIAEFSDCLLIYQNFTNIVNTVNCMMTKTPNFYQNVQGK